MRSISDMINEVRSQTAEVAAAVERLRMSNRRMMGGTGQAPTQTGAIKGGGERDVPETPPLLVALNMALEQLNAATADMRDELNYLENITETGAPSPDKAAYDAKYSALGDRSTGLGYASTRA